LRLSRIWQAGLGGWADADREFTCLVVPGCWRVVWLVAAWWFRRRHARRGGAVAVVAADGFEEVVAGGPQVQLEAGFGVAVVQVAAEAGEQLGEDRLDDRRSAAVEGLAFGGVEPGGHGLPAGQGAGWCFAVTQPPGLAGFFGDRDVQLGLGCGGEVGVAGVPGVK
jgi:hypothetical protein